MKWSAFKSQDFNIYVGNGDIGSEYKAKAPPPVPGDPEYPLGTRIRARHVWIVTKGRLALTRTLDGSTYSLPPGTGTSYNFTAGAGMEARPEQDGTRVLCLNSVNLEVYWARDYIKLSQGDTFTIPSKDAVQNLFVATGSISNSGRTFTKNKMLRISANGDEKVVTAEEDETLLVHLWEDGPYDIEPIPENIEDARAIYHTIPEEVVKIYRHLKG